MRRMRIYTYDRGRGITFTPREKRDLLITWLVLSFAFFMAWGGYAAPWPYAALFVLGISALAVFTGVILHEVGHKLESLKVGIWAEYRKWDMGLLIAFLTSLFGFLFAAPGAVHIMGMGTRKDMERIAVGGIRVNMLLAAALLATFFILGGVGSLTTILWFIASVNSYLALFNMLPIPPLDGFQLMRLNFPKYIVYLVGVGVLFAVIQMAFFLLAYI